MSSDTLAISYVTDVCIIRMYTYAGNRIDGKKVLKERNILYFLKKTFEHILKHFIFFSLLCQSHPGLKFGKPYKKLGVTYNEEYL